MNNQKVVLYVEDVSNFKYLLNTTINAARSLVLCFPL